MRTVLLLSLLAGGALPVMIPQVAMAQTVDKFAGPGLIDILPTGEVIGDGATKVRVQVVALQPDGQPWTDLKLKPGASAGTVDNFVQKNPGLYQFDFVPPKVDATTQITLSLKGKAPNKMPVNAVLPMPVRPSYATSVDTGSNPPDLVLGQTMEATLSMTLVGTSGQPLSGADVAVTTNTGKVQNVTDMGGGRLTARFMAPRVNYPHLAVVAAADKRNPDEAYGYTVIPLKGKVDYPVQASPNSNVILRIGDREFGPVQASPEGKAKIPVVVPPGVNAATLISVLNGQSTEEPIDLRVPETKRVHLVPFPPAIPADSRQMVPLRLIALNPDGTPDLGAKAVFEASVGRFTPPEHEGNGVYRANYLPPDGGAETVKLTAKLEGSSVQTVTQEVKLLAPLPDAVVLTTDPPQIPEEATQFKAFAKVTGKDAKGLTGRTVMFEALQAKAEGQVTDLKGGDYKVDMTSTAPAGAALRSWVKLEPTGLPARHLFVVPASEHVPNDGASTVGLTVVSTDAFGHPVAKVPVKVELISGDGVIGKEATTDGNGRVHLTYTAGKAAQLVRVRVTAGDTNAGTAIVQAPAAMGVIDLQVGGTPKIQALTQRWTASLPTLQVVKEGADAAAVPVAAGGALSDGPIASMTPTATPSPAPPGSEVEIVVAAADASGVAVAGKTLDVMTSKGELGPITDAGDGSYKTTLTLPDDYEGIVKLSIFAPGGLAKLFEIEASKDAGGAAVAAAGAGAASAWGPTAPPAGEGTEGEGTEGEGTEGEGTEGDGTADAQTEDPNANQPPPPTVPAADHAWLRARAGFVASSYRYQQLPSAEPGPLVPDSLNVGRKYEGGKNAAPVGFEVDGRAWLPEMKYVGFQGRFRATHWSLQAAEVFDGTATDWLYQTEADVIGRYPFDVGADQYWVGAKAGLGFNDFLMFTGCLDPGCTPEYEPLPLIGVKLGVEAGAEFGEDAYLIAGMGQHFANATIPYGRSFDAHAGYNFTESIFGDLGFESVYRRLVLEGTESGFDRGELNDTQNMFKVSAGFWM